MGKGVYRTTTWALCDQGIVSGGNFLTNLILIRTLPPSSYGAYALVLNAILFLNNLHTNMVAYPVCMEGAKADDDELRAVATGGLVATVLGLVVTAILITAACLSLHRPSLIPIVAIATLCWQLQETLRTVFVSRLAYMRAIWGDGLSYLGQAAVLAVLCWHRVPALWVIFGVILGTSLLAGLVQAAQIRPRRIPRAALDVFFAELWRLGKWSTLAKVVAFFTSQAFPWLLAYTSGLVTVASFQALLQLVSLANPLLLGFNNLIIASIATQRREETANAWAAAHKQIRLAAILLGSFLVIVALAGRLLMRLIYGSHSPYLAYAPMLRLFALAFAFESISMFAGAILGGLGETRYNFIAQFSAMLVSVLVVFPWIIHSGLHAAAFGLVVVAAARAIVGSYLAHLGIQREKRLVLA